MKAEDAQRLWEGTDGARPWLELHPSDRVYFVEFARACEQHGIERARDVASTHEGSTEYINWSALDAEIAKENEDG